MLVACLAALNGGLAWLVGSMRPARLGNRVLAAALVLNAAAVVVGLAFRAAGDGRSAGASFALNLATVAPLLVLPVVVPWQRLQGRALQAWMLLVSVVTAGFVCAILLNGLAPDLVAGWPALPTTALIHGASALALLLFLDAYLAPRSNLQREMAFFFLLPFALHATVLNQVPSTLWDPWLLTGIADRPVSLDRPWLDGLGVLVLDVAILTVPLTIAASRWRGRSRGEPWPWRRDALVLIALAAGYALVPLGVTFSVDYLLLRPVFLSYGILRYQFLAVDLRRHRVVLVGALAAGLLAVFLLVYETALAHGLVAGPTLGLAFFIALGIAVLLGVPLLRVLLGHDDTEPRRELVYRAALEAAVQEGQDLQTSATLRALRHQLRLTQGDHARLVGDGGALAEGLQPGALFRGRYRVVRRLGAGASGEVYLARDEQEGRDVAVKRLAGHLRRDARALQRFEREVRLSRGMEHPHIVKVHEVELVGGDAYLVLEYAPRGSLQDRLDRDGPLSEPEARRVAREIAEALAALHAQGIVHRDVKPSNVLLAADGRALLADFTIAQDAVSGETVGATGPARAAGTPAFMSPEQARGVRVGPASDVYSLGATLYAALAGRPPVPVAGLGDFEARLWVAREAPALPIAEASVDLNAVLARALEKDPAGRFPDGAAFARALAASSASAASEPATRPGTRAGSGRRR